MSDNVVLKFDSPYSPKIEKFDDFEGSLFSDVYEMACRSIIDIMDGVKVESYDENYDLIYNIIPFMGERGSGKTSAMLSFLNYLKSYHKISDKVNEQFKMGERNFIVMKPIDAGHLEENENLFGIVLARMLGYYNSLIKTKGNDEQAYRRSAIYTSFSNIYTNLMNLNGNNEAADLVGKSPLVVLSELDASQNLRDSFIKLVKEFIKAVEEIDDDIRKGKTSIVISIDDIDMNLQGTHKMLEQIQSYMMIPNVIIMLTASYDNLMCICQNYYSLYFKEIIHASSRAKTQLDRRFLDSCNDLSHEYLNKLLPTGKMIHLRQQHNCILHVPQGDTNIFVSNSEAHYNDDEDTMLIEKENEKYYPYTLVVASIIARSTGICFYANQRRAVVLEPKSIRAKGQYISKIKCFSEVFDSADIGNITFEGNSNNLNKIINNLSDKIRNLKLLSQDIAVRHIGTFPETQRRKLNVIESADLNDISRKIYFAVKNIHKIHETDYMLPWNCDDETRNIYNFADIVDMLDSISNIADEEYSRFVNTVFALVSCKLELEKNWILQSRFKRKYEQINKNKEYEEKNKANFNIKEQASSIEYGLIKKYIGNSLFSWFDNQLMRTVGLLESTDEFDFFAQRDANESRLFIGCKNDLNINSEIVKERNKIFVNLSFDLERIHVYALLLMFLSSHQYNLNLIYEEEQSIYINQNNELKKELRSDTNRLQIEFTADVDFSVSSFFVNIYKPKIIINFYTSILKEVVGKADDIEIEKLLKETLNVVQSIFDENASVCKYAKKLENQLKNNSFNYDNIKEVISKIERLLPETENGIVPALNMELMYNMARGVKKHMCKNDDVLNPWSAVCEYFEAFGNELKAVDSYYGNTLFRDGIKDDSYVCGTHLYEKYKDRVPRIGKENETSFFILSESEKSIFNDVIKSFKWIRN